MTSKQTVSTDTIKPQGNTDPNGSEKARSANSNEAANSNPETSSRLVRIAEAAYQRAHARNFAPGAELEDWLAAEREVDGK